ncbi:MAG: hypothetical protein ACK5N0_12970 [Synechococcaceae cyanobacterium]
MDAALVSVAGLSVDLALDGPDPEAEFCAAAELLDEAALAGSGINAIPLGDLPLVLVHAGCHRQALEQGARGMQWKLLVPAAEQQPLLWNELEQLGLLPMQECLAANAESWLAHLQTEPHLLPADLSLLEGRPWCEAGLLAVPPPEPLVEKLWLLVRTGDAEQPQLADLIETLRLRILVRHPTQS